MNGITVSGAYGRDYKSKRAALEDWHAGKDFAIRGMSSGYVSRSEAEADGLTVSIRYNNDRSVVIVP